MTRWCVIIDGLLTQELADELAARFRTSNNQHPATGITIRVARSNDVKGIGYTETPTRNGKGHKPHV